MNVQMMSLCHKYETPNIKMQGTGMRDILLGISNQAAADLER